MKKNILLAYCFVTVAVTKKYAQYRAPSPIYYRVVTNANAHSNVWHSNALSNAHSNAYTSFECAFAFAFECECKTFAFAFECHFKTFDGSNVLSNAFQLLGYMNIIASPDSQFDVLLNLKSHSKGHKDTVGR